VSPLQQTDSAAPAENGAARFGHGRRRLAIVETLLAEVFQGRIRAGDRLVMEDLSARLGVSPTPVREALITLAGIGIVEFLPNRGAVVRRFTATDIRELCQVRRALECEAVRLACGRIELAELHDLAGEFRRVMAIQKLTIAFIENCRGLDSRLHDLVAESCGNRFLAQELGRLKLLFRAIRDVAWEREKANTDCHRCAGEAAEHLAIVEALLVGDSKQAVRAMARHIRSGQKYWSRALPQ
jgi:DNA-binding GntR family transcriptional regulator